MKQPVLSLQLYSLRNETAIAAEATLRQVPSLGYDGVELAGDYGWSAQKWRSLLAETGLSVVGAHLGLEDMENGFDAQIAFHQSNGNRRLIVSWLPESVRNPDGYRDAARRMNVLALKLKEEGFELLYHNHDFEFAPLENGGNGMEILLQEAAEIRFEIDTYWVERSGLNSHEFLLRNAPRIGMIHAKELRKADTADVPAGQGDIDFKAIIPLARQNDWPVVVEYEGENAIEACRESASYLRRI